MNNSKVELRKEFHAQSIMKYKMKLKLQSMNEGRQRTSESLDQ